MKTRWGIAAICLAVVLGLPGFGNAEIKLFQETFFTQPVGLLFGNQTGFSKTGPAELGTLSLENQNPSVNRATVRQDTEIPGKYLEIYSENPATIAPIFTGRVAPLPVGSPYAAVLPNDAKFTGYGTYEVRWTAKCPDTDPLKCDQGLVEIRGNVPNGPPLWGSRSVPIFELFYAGDDMHYLTKAADITIGLDPSRGSAGLPQHFRLQVKITDTPDKNSLTLYFYDDSAVPPAWVTRAPMLLDNTLTSIDSFNFTMRSVVGLETYVISDLQIVKLTGDNDGDRIEDVVDNCPGDYNPGQSDQDKDQIGDLCDPCPSTVACPPDDSPTGNVASFTPDGFIETCVTWPNVTAPDYAFPPDCYNVHYVLEDNATGQVLEPQCQYPKAYDILAGTVDIRSGGTYCTQPCDLRTRYPQLPETDPLNGITIKEIFYENYIVDPWLDPSNGNCFSIGADETSCRGIWVGRIDIPTPGPPVYSAPIPQNDSLTTPEDTDLAISTAVILNNDSDADGNTDTLKVTSKFTQPLNGNVVQGSDGSFTYSPAENFNGNDSFTYEVSDGKATASATISIDVTSVNDAPVASNDSLATSEDTDLEISTAVILGNDSDADGDDLSVTSGFTQPLNGHVVQGSDGSFTYSPTENFNGNDSFTYEVTDGTATASATILINVTSVNDAPVASDDSASTDEDQVLNGGSVLGNDDDSHNAAPSEGNPLLIGQLVSDVSHGTLNLAPDGTYSYAANADYNGTDSFSYRAVDSLGGTSDPATVTININAVADIKDDSDLTTKGTAVTTNVLDNDSFEGLPTVAASQVVNGTIAVNFDKTVTYFPNPDFVGTGSYKYTVTSGGVTETAAVTISVKYAWGGFLQPIDINSINKVKAGRSIPIKFSLGGFQGMEVFAPTYPKSVATVCGAASGWVNDIDEEIGTPGGSGLTYDSATDQYSYVWKTNKNWKDCRQLQVKFADGSERLVVFEFK